MGKTDMFKSASQEEIDRIHAGEELRDITYAMNMLALQEKAGLTYKEARAHLSPHWELTGGMAEDLGIDVHSVYNLQRRAKKKIEASGFTEEEIYGKWTPIRRTIL